MRGDGLPLTVALLAFQLLRERLRLWITPYLRQPRLLSTWLGGATPHTFSHGSSVGVERTLPLLRWGLPQPVGSRHTYGPGSVAHGASRSPSRFSRSCTERGQGPPTALGLILGCLSQPPFIGRVPRLAWWSLGAGIVLAWTARLARVMVIER